MLDSGFASIDGSTTLVLKGNDDSALIGGRKHTDGSEGDLRKAYSFGIVLRLTHSNLARLISWHSSVYFISFKFRLNLTF